MASHEVNVVLGLVTLVRSPTIGDAVNVFPLIVPMVVDFGRCALFWSFSNDIGPCVSPTSSAYIPTQQR